MAGRPTDCTPETTEMVCEVLALGVTWAAAAAHAGVALSTVMDWCARGRNGESPFTEFLEATTRARDAAEVRMAAVVVRAAEEGNLTAAQFWLERQRPAQWGRKDGLAVVVDKADPQKTIAAMLAKMTGGGGEP